MKTSHLRLKLWISTLTIRVSYFIFLLFMQTYYHYESSSNFLRSSATNRTFHFIQAYFHTESSSNFLMGAGPWWTGGVNCTGSEGDLRDCPHVPLGQVRTCNKTHTAGVLCYRNTGMYQWCDNKKIRNKKNRRICPLSARSGGFWTYFGRISWNLPKICKTKDLSLGIVVSNLY